MQTCVDDTPGLVTSGLGLFAQLT